MSKCVSLPPSPPQLQPQLAPEVTYYDLTEDDEIPWCDLKEMTEGTTRDDYGMSKINNTAPHIISEVSSGKCAMQDKIPSTCGTTALSGMAVNGDMTRRRRDTVHPNELILHANEDDANGTRKTKKRPKLILRAKEAPKQLKLILLVNGKRIS